MERLDLELTWEPSKNGRPYPKTTAPQLGGTPLVQADLKMYRDPVVLPACVAFFGRRLYMRLTERGKK